MSQTLIHSVENIKMIDGVPFFDQINYPVIVIKDRAVRVTLDDKDGNKVELKFHPYQAIKLTTQDCYLDDKGGRGSVDKLIYRRTSIWLDELKAALHKVDKLANFLDKTIHFIIPAGDDMLEIAAWKIEITHFDKTIIFPEK